jgi:hypothetical protein
MKKVLLVLLAAIVVLGVLAGAGFVGYRIGYNQGAASSGNVPSFGFFERMNPNLMPMHEFDRDWGPGSSFYRTPMMRRGDIGFNLFYPLRFLWNIAVLALVAWFVYWLFTKSGWRITRQAVREQEVPPARTEG